MIDDILKLKKYVKIVHHIEGRIRLKAESAIVSEPLFKKVSGVDEGKINTVCAEIPGVIDSRVNLMARSLVVRYDPSVISPQQLETLITTSDDEKAREIIINYKNENNTIEGVAHVQ